MNYEVLERLELADFEDSKWRLENLLQAFQEDGLSHQAAKNMVDLCAISSAELALTMQATISDEPISSIHVKPEVVPFASLKMDSCGTLIHMHALPNRIENRQALLFDLFMFSSDHEKLIEIMGPDPERRTLENLRENFTTWMEMLVEEITKSQVSEAMGLTDARNQDILHFEALLWRLRLGVLLQEEEEANETSLRELAERWNVGEGTMVTW